MNQYPPQPYGYYPPQPQMQNGLGIASLILGIFTIPWAFVPMFGFLCYPFALAVLLMGLTGAGRVKRRLATNYKTALTGVWLGIFSLALPPIMFVVVSVR